MGGRERGTEVSEGRKESTRRESEGLKKEYCDRHRDLRYIYR